LLSKLSKQDNEGQIKFPCGKTELTDKIPNIKNSHARIKLSDISCS